MIGNALVALSVASESTAVWIMNVEVGLCSEFSALLRALCVGLFDMNWDKHMCEPRCTVEERIFAGVFCLSSASCFRSTVRQSQQL